MLTNPSSNHEMSGCCLMPRGKLSSLCDDDISLSRVCYESIPPMNRMEWKFKLSTSSHLKYMYNNLSGMSENLIQKY